MDLNHTIVLTAKGELARKTDTLSTRSTSLFCTNLLVGHHVKQTLYATDVATCLTLFCEGRMTRKRAAHHCSNLRKRFFTPHNRLHSVRLRLPFHFPVPPEVILHVAYARDLVQS